MKRKCLLLILVVVCMLGLQAAGPLARPSSQSGQAPNLGDLEQQQFGIAPLKNGMAGLFDTHFELARDVQDADGAWPGGNAVRIDAAAPKTLELRRSTQTVRKLKLRNEKSGQPVRAVWTPHSDSQAPWWDLSAKSFPPQNLTLKPGAEHTLIVLKGGGSLEFAILTGTGESRIEFLVAE
jgi:hypothetical protein